MGASFSDILSYFEKEHKGHFRAAEEEGFKGVKKTVQGKNSSYNVTVVWDDEVKSIHFWVVDIMTIPQPKRATACVLVNMINWELTHGNFALNMEDGKLMVQFGFWVKDGTLGHEQIDFHFNIAVMLADQWYPAFQKLAWADVSPEEALKIGQVVSEHHT